MAEAFLTADILLSTLQNVSEGLVVYPKVRTNIQLAKLSDSNKKELLFCLDVKEWNTSVIVNKVCRVTVCKDFSLF